jgi:hypothetical protein
MKSIAMAMPLETRMASGTLWNRRNGSAMGRVLQNTSPQTASAARKSRMPIRARNGGAGDCARRARSCSSCSSVRTAETSSGNASESNCRACAGSCVVRTDCSARVSPPASAKVTIT